MAQNEQSTAKDIIQELDIDAAYLSRILSTFERDGFDETFEALVAEILARFIQHHYPKQERI